jgi:pyruvate,orthophosphate dikinase
MTDKWVYRFGNGTADGAADMRELLGGKGANLAEMSAMGLPVPPGFTVTTGVCSAFYANDRAYPDGLETEVDGALGDIETVVGAEFGNSDNPLLVSVRSGAPASMPGMMDTVLNLGLNDKTVEGLARQSGDARFAYDSYRRFIQMYSDVVLGVEHHLFEALLDDHKNARGLVLDTELGGDDWKAVVEAYKNQVATELGKPFPQDPGDQLWGAIGAVFGSWMNKRAVTYRRLHNIPAHWGTAVNVQGVRQHG